LRALINFLGFMRFVFLGPVGLALLLIAAGPPAKLHPTTARTAATPAPAPRFDAGLAIAGLRTVGSVAGVVPEGSGLVPAVPADTYYSFGDSGNPPRWSWSST